MSENKCPCCGCPMVEKYLGWVCPADNCAFRCSTNSLPRIAAAMELAKATAKRKEKYDKEREAWIISDSANDEAEKELLSADREVNDASWRVLEVWNG